MRQQLDVAVLCQPENRGWFDEVLSDLSPALEKIKLHEVDWTAQAELAPLCEASPRDVHFQPQIVAQSMLALRRYDALLLSVTLHTLAWTRQCLASVPRGPNLPILGVFHDLRSGAMLDLLELGLTDFICTPVCPQSFRARLITAVCRAPRQVPLREDGRYQQHAVRGIYDPRRPGQLRPMHLAEARKPKATWTGVGFSEAKQRVVDHFEQQYLRAAMQRAGGRITAAARHAEKDRRAFWELLRKHDLLKEWPAQRRAAQKARQRL